MEHDAIPEGSIVEAFLDAGFDISGGKGQMWQRDVTRRIARQVGTNV